MKIILILGLVLISLLLVGCGSPYYYCEDTEKIQYCQQVYDKDCYISSLRTSHINCPSGWINVKGEEK